MPAKIKLILFLVFLVISNHNYGQENKKLEAMASKALAFCKSNKMDTAHCILVDMGIHSGKNRFRQPRLMQFL